MRYNTENFISDLEPDEYAKIEFKWEIYLTLNFNLTRVYSICQLIYAWDKYLSY